MKRIFYIVLLSTAASTMASGQLVSKPPEMMTDTELGHYYLKKSKNQKTWGWIMLATSAGFYIAANSAMQGEKVYTTENSTGKVCFILGTGALVGSIPLFSNSARNKGRADILLKIDRTPTGYLPQGPTMYPALGLKIPIGK